MNLRSRLKALEMQTRRDDPERRELVNLGPDAPMNEQQSGDVVLAILGPGQKVDDL